MADAERPTRSRKRKCDSNKDALDAILARLNSLEQRFHVPPPPTPEPFVPQLMASPELPVPPSSAAADDNFLASANRRPLYTSRESIPNSEDTTGRIVEVISSLVKVRSQNYFISNFDPKVHNIDVWCEEVDRAKETNGWDDNECLSRIGNYLKGDARIWLHEWSSSDRSWTNFKRDFKALCPRDIDIASILYEVMSTNSNGYDTYAEYARRSLLKLALVRGLSDELIVAIVLRGIVDPHVKAAATNSKLQPNDLVQFLSMYVKLKSNFKSTRESFRAPHAGQSVARHSDGRKINSDMKCHFCGKFGHKRIDCHSAKRQRLQNYSGSKNSNPSQLSTPPQIKTCTFCKKNGHTADDCFAKQRSESSSLNVHSVNFCSKLDDNVIKCSNDVTSAVIQSIPIDVLVDSGSCISLISSSVLKHFKTTLKPTYRVLKGIGSQHVESTSFVTLVIELPRISIEADLYVVPHYCISIPVIIGTDILNREGITYIRQNGVQILTHTEVTATVNNTQFNVQNVDTPLLGADREQLLSVISDYSSSFITGTATSTVTTGTMKIALTTEAEGYKYVLVIIDAFSKYFRLYALYRQDTSELKRAYTDAVSLFGSPKLLVTDRARMFESSSFQDMVRSLGSDIHFITPGMHHENGQAERYCRTLLNLLRIEVNHRQQSWPEVLWKTQLILNSTRHSTTNLSPLQLLIGSESSTPIIRALVRDVALDIATSNREATMALRRQHVSSLLSANQQRQDEYVNKNRKSPRGFEVNDKVFVIKASQAAGKLNSCMRGPYKVLKCLPHHRYELELLVASYGKRTEAAAENMVLWAGEWTPETCAAFLIVSCTLYSQVLS
ncbi:uncharacterized protein LOC113235768 [Hyposmocoma kahamanoa]|uniref:uncharacterized protein LOC113235768 n=1 Tax=Hyposmocoma kahamanoa TaxID=1477025 RepID=UPI000E6D8A92|nr:uncharacterized protein LOC113235768 [Hyposmocoma kahamanoa]